MRDSINYTLNYFIMRMSGTKPIKNTVRKSPIRQDKPLEKNLKRTSAEAIAESKVKGNSFGADIKRKKIVQAIENTKKYASADKAKIKATEEKYNPTKKLTNAERTAKITADRSMSKEDRAKAIKSSVEKLSAKTAPATKKEMATVEAAKKAKTISKPNQSTTSSPKPNSRASVVEGKPNASTKATSANTKTISPTMQLKKRKY